MIEKAIKQRIVEALKVARPKYASASKMAVALGINSAQLSRIVNGDTDNVLSDANWLSIARRLDVQLNDAAPWQTARWRAAKRAKGATDGNGRIDA